MKRLHPSLCALALLARGESKVQAPALFAKPDLRLLIGFGPAVSFDSAAAGRGL